LLPDSDGRPNLWARLQPPRNFARGKRQPLTGLLERRPFLNGVEGLISPGLTGYFAGADIPLSARNSLVVEFRKL